MIKIVSLFFDAALNRFDDSELKEVLDNKRVDSLCHYFFVHNGVPCLTFVMKLSPPLI